MDLTTASANVAASPALLPARASRARRRLPCNARIGSPRRRRPSTSAHPGTQAGFKAWTRPRLSQIPRAQSFRTIGG
jgi:hypothetical protein